MYPQTLDSAASKESRRLWKVWQKHWEKTLGKNIRKQRKEKGFSQDTFALVCGIDRSYMGRIERGEVNITVDKLYRLASTLACEPAYLLPSMSSLE